MDPAVIDIGDLEHLVHPGVSGSPFTEDHLPHPPVIHFLLGHLLWDLHDHEIPRFNPVECWYCLCSIRKSASNAVICDFI